MYRLFLIAIASLFSIHMFLPKQVGAQSPEKMSYQVVIRDANNHLIVNQFLGIQISILQASANGTAVYVETQTSMTNANGLLSVEIGTGTIVSGDFRSIDWANNQYFIKTEIDPTGGMNYALTETSQLISVPYALYAKTAENYAGAISETDPIFTSSPASKISALDLTNLMNLTGVNSGDHDLSILATKSALGDSIIQLRSEIPDMSRFLSKESDLVFANSPAAKITNTDIVNLSNLSGANCGDQDLSALAGRIALMDSIAKVRAEIPDVSGFITSELDGSIHNEIQELSIRNDTLFLSSGGYVVLPTDSTNSLDAAYDKGNIMIADSGALSIAGTDGFNSSGSFGQGDTLSVSGAGTRMIWFPKKSAYRVGYVDNTHWDEDSLGDYSFAIGYKTKATADNSTVIGINSMAYSEKSTAIGYNAKTMGYGSIALGFTSEAVGDASIAIGRSNTAIGRRSTAMGLKSSSESYASIAIGRYNLGGGDASQWLESDPLFEIGNGTSKSDSSNALTVYKDGTMQAAGQIKNLEDPTDEQDAATKAYVDALIERIEALEEYNLLNDGFIDSRDGTHYETVKIGNQIWMAENLAYLPRVNMLADGSEDAEGAYYYVFGYDGTDVSAAKATSNYINRGVLYNWTAVMDGSASSWTNPSGVQGVCPNGWHLPSFNEWWELVDYLGGEGIAGGKIKETGTTHWYNPNVGATNESGFTARSGGYRSSVAFRDLELNAYWWTSTENSDNTMEALSYYASSWDTFCGQIYKGKTQGLSVRCVKD